MKIVYRCFLQMMRTIRHDMMLFAVCLGPVLCGMLIKFGIPFLESFLCIQLQKKAFLAPYYGLLDVFLPCWHPSFFALRLPWLCLRRPMIR